MPSQGITRWSALCGLLAPVVSIILIGVASALRPGYSQVSQFMSELGVGPNGILLDAAVILSSLLFIVFFLGLHLDVQGGQGSKVPVALAVGGNLFEMVAGFSPCSVADCSAFDLHIASFVTGAVLILISFPFFARRFQSDPRWERFRGWTLAAFAVALVVFVVLLLGLQSALVAEKGLLQRIVVGVYYIWVVAVALHLGRSPGHAVTVSPAPSTP